MFSSGGVSSNSYELTYKIILFGSKEEKQQTQLGTILVI